VSEYQKECNRCGQKIKMSNELGKWKAFDLDGKNIHDCNKPKNDTNSHSDISLEVVLRKLQSIGITLDLEKLRNATNGEIIKK